MNNGDQEYIAPKSIASDDDDIATDDEALDPLADDSSDNNISDDELAQQIELVNQPANMEQITADLMPTWQTDATRSMLIKAKTIADISQAIDITISQKHIDDLVFFVDGEKIQYADIDAIKAALKEVVATAISSFYKHLLPLSQVLRKQAKILNKELLREELGPDDQLALLRESLIRRGSMLKQYSPSQPYGSLSQHYPIFTCPPKNSVVTASDYPILLPQSFEEFLPKSLKMFMEAFLVVDLLNATSNAETRELLEQLKNKTPHSIHRDLDELISEKTTAQFQKAILAWQNDIQNSFQASQIKHDVSTVALDAAQHQWFHYLANEDNYARLITDSKTSAFLLLVQYPEAAGHLLRLTASSFETEELFQLRQACHAFFDIEAIDLAFDMTADAITIANHIEKDLTGHDIKPPMYDLMKDNRRDQWIQWHKMFTEKMTADQSVHYLNGMIEILTHSPAMNLLLSPRRAHLVGQEYSGFFIKSLGNARDARKAAMEIHCKAIRHSDLPLGEKIFKLELMLKVSMNSPSVTLHKNSWLFGGWGRTGAQSRYLKQSQKVAALKKEYAKENGQQWKA